jgi:hypothetical protein
MCLSLDEPLHITGTEAETSPGEFHLLQLTTSSHRVNGLNLEAEHHRYILCCQQAIFFRLYKAVFVILSRQLSEVEARMGRCPQCNGYLLYEPEFLETPARVKCAACGWMVSDPRFRKEEPR